MSNEEGDRGVQCIGKAITEGSILTGRARICSEMQNTCNEKTILSTGKMQVFAMWHLTVADPHQWRLELRKVT